MPYWQSIWLTNHGYRINIYGTSTTEDANISIKYEKSTPDHYHDEYSHARWLKILDTGYPTHMDGGISGKSYDLLHGFTIKPMETFNH